MKTKVRISTEFRARWRWCSCSDVGFVSSRLSIVESTGITTSKLHKRSDSPSQPSWNLTELFDTISANPCECHAATAGCKAGKKKETNRWRTWNGKDEPWKFCHFSKYTWECWNVEIMFKRVSNELYIFLRLFLYILYSLEILRRDRSGQYFFRSMHSSNSKLFYLIFPFFFSWKVLGAERIHTRRIYTKRWNNPSEIRRKRRRSFLRYLGAFLENRFVRAHREREGIIPKDAKGG